MGASCASRGSTRTITIRTSSSTATSSSKTPSGGITIYGYPQDVFPPTDNHSATLAGDDVFVIGNLGYIHRRRPAETPVVRLDTKTFAMHPVATQGAPPGGICHHTATLSADGGAIVVTGGQRTVVTGDRFNLVQSPDDWRLDLQTLVWKRLTDRRWEQWELRRTDGKGNELWKRDMAYRYGREDKPIDKWTFEGLGDPATVWANRGLHETRYSPPMAHEVLPEQEGVPLVLRRVVEGVVVRYVEDSYAVEVIVEGVLPAAVLETHPRRCVQEAGGARGRGVREEPGGVRSASDRADDVPSPEAPEGHRGRGGHQHADRRLRRGAQVDVRVPGPFDSRHSGGVVDDGCERGAPHVLDLGSDLAVEADRRLRRAAGRRALRDRSHGPRANLRRSCGAVRGRVGVCTGARAGVVARDVDCERSAGEGGFKP